MTTIQKIALFACEAGLGSDPQLDRLAPDELRARMVNTFLEDISKLPTRYTFDELRFMRAWNEPRRIKWNRACLWRWFISDGRHLEKVENALLSQLANKNEPTILECIEDALWEESWETFAGVKAYLLEKYNRQSVKRDHED